MIIKKMSYTLIAKKKGDDDSKSWKEPGYYYPDDEDEDLTPELHAKEIVNYFNRTLRPGEEPREFVAVEGIELLFEEINDEEE